MQPTEVWSKTEFKTWFKRKDKITHCLLWLWSVSLGCIPQTGIETKIFRLVW